MSTYIILVLDLEMFLSLLLMRMMTVRLYSVSGKNLLLMALNYEIGMIVINDIELSKYLEVEMFLETLILLMVETLS